MTESQAFPIGDGSGAIPCPDCGFVTTTVDAVAVPCGRKPSQFLQWYDYILSARLRASGKRRWWRV